MLGEYPAVSLADARTAALQSIAVVSTGGDPKYVAEVGGIAFDDLAELYMERYSLPRKRSSRLDREIIDRDLLPAWRGRPAASIRKREVVALLDAIVDRGSPIQANRTRSVVSGIFAFGLKRDLVEFNPVAGTDMPAPEVKRDRVLSDEEIREFWRSTANMQAAIRDALRGILLTGQRPGEVAGLTRSELSGDSWIIPAARMKQKREHVVPVVGLFAEIVTASGSPVLFASRDRLRFGLPIERSSLSAAMLRMRRRLGWPDTRPHDLRRTAATNMARLGVSRFVVSRVLAHTDSSITGTYDRWEYAQEKRDALSKWDAHVRALIAGPAGA